jgi:hypothetical protein
MLNKIMEMMMPVKIEYFFIMAIIIKITGS